MNSHADYKNAVVGLNDEGDYSSIVDVEPVNKSLKVIFSKYGICLSFY